ncbi:DUF2867 domain-containing protein [Alkalitalea saponilacus]|uniref:DUF2867 domain-containing protein n=1 Tax=Alkalitalea saponilacus TaxID=889453 RepID=A0A1T5D441_9BACT|nr:DUF2867 domain-containing protein [Alkalitalea saponilacus]ASB50569.1 hypothetical protein CDL62_16170 [Alkalitalea saponilacus]SKB66455.1 Protein of unknown function [Alkalitalea saponilacus]
MITITKQNKIPKASILNKIEEPFNYIDSFCGFITTNGKKINKVDFLNQFKNSGPRWGDQLLVLRDKIVGIFGLKTSNKTTNATKQLDKTEYLIGEQIGIFKLFDQSENEYILGENDKHLNFRVSLLTENGGNGNNKTKLTITTAVKFNNIFGNIYFFPVKPIHKLLVRASLKKTIQQLEREILNN